MILIIFNTAFQKGIKFFFNVEQLHLILNDFNEQTVVKNWGSVLRAWFYMINIYPNIVYMYFFFEILEVNQEDYIPLPERTPYEISQAILFFPQDSQAWESV